MAFAVPARHTAVMHINNRYKWPAPAVTLIPLEARSRGRAPSATVAHRETQDPAHFSLAHASIALTTDGRPVERRAEMDFGGVAAGMATVTPPRSKFSMSLPHTAVRTIPV